MRYKLTLLLILFTFAFSSCCTLTNFGRSKCTIAGRPGTVIRYIENDKYLGTIKNNGYAVIKLKNTKDSAKLLFIDPDGYRETMDLRSNFDFNVVWNIFFFPGFIVDFATENCYNFNGIYGDQSYANRGDYYGVNNQNVNVNNNSITIKLEK